MLCFQIVFHMYVVLQCSGLYGQSLGLSSRKCLPHPIYLWYAASTILFSSDCIVSVRKSFTRDSKWLASCSVSSVIISIPPYFLGPNTTARGMCLLYPIFGNNALTIGV